jgi:N-acyl-D-amino-acid deacylase
MRVRSLLFVAVILISVLLVSHRYRAAQIHPEFDLVITRGRVVDGSGNPWFEADIALKDGKIAAMGKIAADRGARSIDALGKTVAPGFIDVHTHIESEIESIPTADNFSRMGVTSVITGNCGSSFLEIGEFLSRLEKSGVSINVGSLVGHNSIRREAMGGNYDRPPSSEELQRMRELAEKAMREGAVGISTGLIYIPGTYSKTDEIAELAKVVSRYGGLYATHMRDEGEELEKSIKEALDIGEQAKCPVEISHFKVTSKKRWGDSRITTGIIEGARARGQQVTVDQYLYTASSTNLGVIFPKWLFDGGPDKVRERLLDPATRERVRKEMIDEAKRRGREDYSYAYVGNHPANPSFNGKNLSEITKLVRQKSGFEEEAEQAIEMLLAGGAGMIYHSMSEEDLERIFRQSYTMVASDSSVINIESPSVPHPRGFGNNARALGYYVRERRLVSLEEAIRKMTSLPAQTFGLWDRGILRPGMAADIVIFDEKTIGDRATFQQPKQFPIGIDYVFVNGLITVRNGNHTGMLPGRVLRGKGFTK